MTVTDTATERLETGHDPQTPADDSLLRRFLHNQAALGETLAQCAGGRVVQVDGLSASWYDTHVVYNNMAVCTSPLTSESLAAAEDLYSDGRSGALLSPWPTEDLTARGWVLVGHPMMVVKAPGHLAVPARDGVTTSVCCTAEDLALLERIAVEGYPMPEAAGAPPNSIYPAGTLDSPLLGRVGYVDGEPVSGAASFLSHDVINLCFAATLAAGRRRGVWAQLVADRVNDEEHLPAVAITSDDSRPGFVKLGFLPVQRTTLWLRP